MPRIFGGSPIPQQWTVVNVHFDVNAELPFQFTGEAVKHFPVTHPEVPVGIEVGVGYNLIIFELTSPQANVAFPHEPFQWVSGRGLDAQPMARPSGIQVQHHDMRRCVLQNLNPNGPASKSADVLYGFHLLVLCNGKLYASADPTIINQTSPDPTPTNI